ncbi:penicillin-binding protein 2 [Cytophagaceae bacterium DM2B3-1]|uniref:Penicillin-binding protein 2 n=1 Tax=Xanthocytophaga flava TaxID=3048013 RepID=A0ABT7CCR5_9BACT|nr:penicillin-binding protein 2 [Xanthocytophaga flavus]MDJ1491494.1 penicillin-binding protein 2 [Xanthocytophaga flavus]
MKDSRRFVIQGIFILVGIVYLVRLFYLQVVDDNYKSQADDNAIRRVIVYPHRGQILDRNGKLIVINESVYDISVIPKKAKIDDTLSFCNTMGVTRQYFDSVMTIATRSKYARGRPTVFLKQLSVNEFAHIQDRLINYPGFFYTSRAVRKYPQPTLANALGYIGEISEKRLENQNYYRQGDYIGISGVESYYEEQLRGQRGVRYVMVNVNGVEKGAFKEGTFDTSAVAGENLISSIDLDLQRYADSLMTNKIGSIVAIEPSTGEILTMVSAPSYDPNLLVGRLFGKNFSELQKNPYLPMYNRPIQAVYRPGSIFKLVQSLVALEEGVIDPQSQFACIKVPMKCHSHPSGHNDLHNAIEWSCNPYFYNVYRRIIYAQSSGNNWRDAPIGLMEWNKHVKTFGFGTRLDVDMPNVKRGFIPDTAIYNRSYGKSRWQFSNFYSVSIGEGELNVVPIQMANLAAIMANRGYYYTPHLIKRIGKNGTPLPQYQEKHHTSIKPEHFQTVVDGMEDAVKRGTVWSKARIPDIVMCGKTGTSQNKKGEKDHSVFVAFAPKDNPKIALAVYVENAGFGGFAAAPIASLIVEKYLKGHVDRTLLEKDFKLRNYMPKPKVDPKALKKDSTGSKPKPALPGFPKPDTSKQTKPIIVSNRTKSPTEKN